MIIRATHPDFWSLYDLLAQRQGWLSAIHGKASLEYYRQLTHDKGELTEDRSYIVLRENIPVAAFIGVLVGSEKKDLLAYGVPCISVEDDSMFTGAVVKEFLREFDSITEDIRGRLCYWDFMPDGQISTLSRHMLSRGALSETIFHRVIAIREDEIMLKRNIRRRYGSLINWGIRELSPQIVTHEDLSWEQMDLFRQLHIREAGRETRTESSWRRQYEWVKQGSAFLVLGHWQGELVSAGMFEYNRTNCIYGLSASRRDLFKRPLFHALMWSAVLHAKWLGCHWFQVGQQVFPRFPVSCPPSPKELGISEFKAGFGGQTRIMLELSLKNEILPPAGQRVNEY